MAKDDLLAAGGNTAATATLSLGLARAHTAAALVETGRRFAAAQSHREPHLACFFSSTSHANNTNANANAKQQVFPQDNKITIVNLKSIPSSRTPFINASFSVFSSLQTIWPSFQQKMAAESLNRKRRNRFGPMSGGYGDLDDGYMNEMSKSDMEDEDMEYRGMSDSSLGYGGLVGDERKNRMSTTTAAKSRLIKISLLYRQEIQNHIRELSKLLEHERTILDANDKNENEEGATRRASLSRELGIFQSMHGIWHLAEIMIMGRDYGTSVVEELVQWVNLTWPKPTRAEFEALSVDGIIPTSERPGFWPYLNRCILRGHFIPAASMLQKLERYKSRGVSNNLRASTMSKSVAKSGSEDASTNPVSILIKLLQTMPRPSSFASSADFENRWRKWHGDCLYHADPSVLRSIISTPSDLPHFSTLFGILAGDENLILKTADTWSEKLVALLLYTNPTTVPSDIASVLETVIPSSSEANISTSQHIMMSLLSMETDEAIRDTSRIDPWLVSHLTDLIDKFNCIEIAQGREPFMILSHPDHVKGDPTLRDVFLMEYAENLALQTQYWRVGVEYLGLCGDSGAAKSRLEASLLRVDVLSHPLIYRKVVGVARRFGLSHVEKEVYRVMGHQAHASGAYGVAMTKFVDGGAIERAVAVGEQVMELYLKERENSKSNQGTISGQQSTVESAASLAMTEMAPSVLASDSRLLFLGKFKEFEKLYASKDSWGKAGSAFIELFTHGLAPRRMWAWLLLEYSLAILEGESIILGVADTFELMRCLEEICTSHKKREYLCVVVGGKSISGEGTDDGMLDRAEKSLDVVRFALTRNLARSMLSGK